MNRHGHSALLLIGALVLTLALPLVGRRGVGAAQPPRSAGGGHRSMVPPQPPEPATPAMPGLPIAPAMPPTPDPAPLPPTPLGSQASEAHTESVDGSGSVTVSNGIKVGGTTASPADAAASPADAAASPADAAASPADAASWPMAAGSSYRLWWRNHRIVTLAIPGATTSSRVRRPHFVDHHHPNAPAGGFAARLSLGEAATPALAATAIATLPPSHRSDFEIGFDLNYDAGPASMRLSLSLDLWTTYWLLGPWLDSW